MLIQISWKTELIYFKVKIPSHTLRQAQGDHPRAVILSLSKYVGRLTQIKNNNNHGKLPETKTRTRCLAQ
jgi:hypothetical protein